MTLRRPGNVAYLMPPDVITDEQMDFLEEIMREEIDRAMFR
jgi:adenosylmethionine-8-amino-7-oxononanoate aminotransferase